MTGGFCLNRKIISFLFCIILAFSSYTVTADNKSELEQQKSNTQSEMNEIREKINQAERSKTPYVEKKKNIDEKMSQANAKLYEINSRINAVQSDINAKEKEIEDLTGEKKKADELFKERMRALYEDNSTSYFDIILNSESISDFFYRMEVIKQISEYDQGIIEQIVNRKEIVEDAKATLETKKEEIEVLKAQAEQEKANVAALQAENQAILDDINGDINTYTQELKAKEREAQRIESQIKALLQSKNQGSSSAPTSGYVWPCPASKYITSYFGRRVHPVYGTVKVHNGLDIGGPNGCDVIAANSGTVIVSEYSSSYGNYIVISHGGGVTTLYAHMSARLVSVGASVTRGQVIGKEGSTGVSTGPHLHFEVAVNGVRCDPLNYVK